MKEKKRTIVSMQDAVILLDDFEKERISPAQLTENETR